MGKPRDRNDFAMNKQFCWSPRANLSATGGSFMELGWGQPGASVPQGNTGAQRARALHGLGVCTAPAPQTCPGRVSSAQPWSCQGDRQDQRDQRTISVFCSAGEAPAAAAAAAPHGWAGRGLSLSLTRQWQQRSIVLT